MLIDNYLVLWLAFISKLFCLSFAKQNREPEIRWRLDSAYLFYQNGTTWHANRAKCKHLNGDLVSMETLEEWEFIKDEIQHLTNFFQNDWHIGLRRHGYNKTSKASWYWVSGVHLNYDRWQLYQPSGDGKCANIAREYLESVGGFNDLSCRGMVIRSRGYICEMINNGIVKAEDGAVYVQQWNNISGLYVTNLTSSLKYPNSSTKEYYTKQFYFHNWNENFGVRMRSYFQAPMTGNFSFYTKCDDSCQLFLSTGVNPQDIRMIINHLPSGKGQHRGEYLIEGRLYYMELLFKQRFQIAHLQIYVHLPNGKLYKSIPAQFLKKRVTEIDRPGKDCETFGDKKFPDYNNCKSFTHQDKLNAVKTVLKELQSNIRNTTKPSNEILEDSMKTAARKITFLLDDVDLDTGQQGQPLQEENGGLEVALEVEQLGNMVAEELNYKQPLTMEYPNIMLQIKKLESHFVFPDKKVNESFQTRDEISIQMDQSEAGKYVVFSSLYKNLEDILKGNISAVGDSEGKFFLNSRIITSSLVPAPKSLEKESVKLKLEHKRFKTSKDQMMVCVFWNFNSSSGNSSGFWSSEGCRLDEKESNENVTSCLCDHLTHFAVLMKVVEDKPLPKAHVTALQAITYVGCSLSLIGEFLTIATLVCLRLTKTETNMIHLNLVVALGLAQIFFLSGITATENKIVCTFVAAALHFFNLVAFCWMLVEGLWLYVMVVRVFDTGYNRIRRYVIAAWSIPAVIVIVTLVSSFDGYGTEHSCWLSVEKGTIWSFVVPVLLIIVVNAVILGLVVREILKLHNPTPSDDSKLQTVRSGVKSAIVLLPILGIAWVFGVLAVNDQTLAFQYLFAIFNSLQGFLIFIFHCVLNSEVRKAFRRKKQIWSDNQIFHCHTTPTPKYDSELSKETRSTTNGAEKRPNSSTSTSKIFIK